MGRIADAMTSSVCPRLSGCAFINVKMKHMPGTVELAKKSYCRSELVVEVGRAVIRVPRGFDAEHLFQVVQTLSEEARS